jgi:cob(I)alamin adenosyltransferase
MVVLNRIYTRTGDQGTTALATGERRPKHDLRIAAYGTVDETNACLGLARLHTAGDALDPMLARIQNDLFDLGADLATPATDDPPRAEPLRIVDAQVERLEREIDMLNADLASLRSFVLPGGTPAAAALHLARTVCRRAERMTVELAARPGESVSPAAVKYLNRLSDFLFVASRSANDKGASDVLWVPGHGIPLRLPAYAAIGFWFVLQLLSAFLSGDEAVGWFAHLGGFVTGAVLILLLRRRYDPVLALVQAQELRALR